MTEEKENLSLTAMRAFYTLIACRIAHKLTYVLARDLQRPCYDCVEDFIPTTELAEYENLALIDHKCGGYGWLSIDDVTHLLHYHSRREWLVAECNIEDEAESQLFVQQVADAIFNDMCYRHKWTVTPMMVW
jgi:hypothetical protein